MAVKTNKRSLFYTDKPLFGLDIGVSSIKVMQLHSSGKQTVVSGYGSIKFDPEAVVDGRIVKHEVLAKAMYELFDKHIIGTIDTRRMAATVPASKAFTRIMTLPSNISHSELDEAVRFEAEQYIPISLDDLYLDYSNIGQSVNSKEMSEIVVVAVPKKIVDSYIEFFDIVGLEPCALETTITASSRLIGRAENSAEIPTILIDCGSVSVDLTIYDKSLIVNGTVPGGGDNFTERIAEHLHVSHQEATTIKYKYGIGFSKKQKEISEAMRPQLELLIKEIRRVIRYYDDRIQNKSKIGQIITMGGGANMPGFSDYLTDNLRIPTRMCDFWHKIDNGNITVPSIVERSTFVTVAGAALIKPKDIWR